MTAVDEGILSAEPCPRVRQFDGRWLTNTATVLGSGIVMIDSTMVRAIAERSAEEIADVQALNV
jgi:hypothetical protein